MRGVPLAMRCISCNSETPSGRKFCLRCGARLDGRCLRCGAENPPDAIFCGDCGAPLNAADLAAITEYQPGLGELAEGTSRATAGTQAQSNEGERRRLSVLFCDLVGSTAIAAALDPEEWLETVRGYQQVAAEEIIRFGGHVAQYLGDGIMAFFGWPEAHDNDAERAARAGLAILEAIATLDELPARPRLSARIGIDSGAVVVDAGGGKEPAIFGDTPNIAARTQAAADPGTLLITAKTHRLVSGLFVVEDRGAHPLKGIELPIQLFRVIQPSGVRGRFEAAAARGLTPFVGREDESRILTNRWERARTGEGQVVLVAGEAGIGKSRLVQRFHEAIAGTPHIWVECATEQFYQNTPFYPVIDMLRQSFRWGSRGQKRIDSTAEVSPDGEVGEAQRLAALEASLELAGLKAAEAIPLIAPLFNLTVPAERYPASILAPEQQRKHLLATLVAWTLGGARVQPLVIVTEDLHWADPSTLELIEMLVEQGATSPLLLIYTARPEFHPQWPAQAHHTQITLNRLDPHDVRSMIQQVAAQKALSDEAVTTVVERTGGVPLFVEELTRAVIERGGATADREIPATLHDSLMARLDRLGPAREIAQVAAVIGREFSYELLHAVHPIKEAKLQSALKQLIDAELVFVRGVPPKAIYTFRHALIRDAAYEALLKRRRRQLHRHISETLEECFPELVKSQAEIAAYHCTEAGLIDQAVRHWQKAAERALTRSANAEAIVNLNKGLELIAKLPDNADRIAREVKLSLMLTTPLIAIKGYAATEVERTCDRARELCAVLKDPVRTFTVCGSLSSIYFNRGELQTAIAMGDQMLQIAQSQQNPVLLMWAHYSLGFALADRGELISAREHFERSLGCYDPSQDYLRYYVQDPGITGSTRLARLLFALGYPEAALRHGREAVTLGRKLSHPYSLCFALGYLGEIHSELGEYVQAERLEEEAIALASQHGLVFMATLGAIWRGSALIGQGCNHEGLELIETGLTRLRTELPGEERLYQKYLLAAAYEKLRQPREGLALTQEIFGDIKQTGKRNMESDLYRLVGDLMLLESDANNAAAEQSFRNAIASARSQQAKTCELRAATSLARMLAGSDRADEARALLGEIYGWFTEGLDTPHLRNAKALIDKLNA
jgi:class 3 adenylate cyclase/tetratricopeptide (TPR) repeat protein/ribosomal protein L40E